MNHGSPYRTGYSPKGRKPQLESVDLLGLALYYLKSKDSVYKLCLIFGIVPTSAYVWLDFSLEVLSRTVTLPHMTDFAIVWPKPAEMEQSANLLRHNREHGHVLEGVFAVLDGARMPCATYEDPNLNNAFWEGFTQQHEVTNLCL